MVIRSLSERVPPKGTRPTEEAWPGEQTCPTLVLERERVDSGPEGTQSSSHCRATSSRKWGSVTGELCPGEPPDHNGQRPVASGLGPLSHCSPGKAACGELQGLDSQGGWAGLHAAALLIFFFETLTVLPRIFGASFRDKIPLHCHL